ncbi:hypothetical protein bthur0012_58870 [Bacillus thuringiensis serovar pulsiensis BGSC 4CC1]|nr:hypothetical protein bthur0012_58870 [Bacillus thuringiensis serovar pulsiensis BGSC 4CC1]
MEEFRYEKADLKNKVNIELKEIIQKEEQFSKKNKNKMESQRLSMIIWFK